MTRDDFIKILIDNNIDPNIVSFDDNKKEGYCIRKNYFRWETLVRERGEEYDVLGFPSEDNALNSLLDEIIGIYKNIK